MFARLWSARSVVWGLLALGLVLRAAVLWRYASLLDEDRDLYRQIASQLVAGKGYSRRLQWEWRAENGLVLSSGPDELALFDVVVDDPDIPADLPTNVWLDLPTAYRPPLFPLLLAATLALFQTHRAIAFVHLLLGVATIGLTLAAARRMDLRGGVWCAGLLVALDPLLLYHAPQVMTETLAAFLTAALLAAATWPRTWRRELLVGGLLGLAALCRPTYLVVAGLWLLADLLPIGGVPMTFRLRRAALIGLASFLVVLPWGVRNRQVLGHWIFATTHGGYTLFLAHNPVYTLDVVQGPWDTGWEQYNRDITFLSPLLKPELPWSAVPEFEVALDREYSRDAWTYLVDDPWIALRSGVTLWRRFWSCLPLQNSSTSTGVRTAIGVFYGVTLALSLLGVWSLWRGDWSRWLPAFALIAGFAAVHFLYWADMRMRAPLTPAIALLAAQGIRRCVDARPSTV